MGYVFMLGACGSCGQSFTFNPMKVPSFKDAKGVKQPVCQSCLTAINKIRKERGLSHAPALSGAYEACPESEIIW